MVLLYLQEKERDMQLAMEERDLQKMATLSQHDEKFDQLQAELDAVNKVGVMNFGQLSALAMILTGYYCFML